MAKLIKVDNNNPPPLLPENIGELVVPQESKEPEVPPDPDKEPHGCVYPNMCLECIFSKEDAKLLEGLSVGSVANPSLEFVGLLSRYEFYFRGMATEANANGQLFEIKKDWVKVRVGVMWYGDDSGNIFQDWKYKVKYELVPEDDNSITIFEFLDWMRQ